MEELRHIWEAHVSKGKDEAGFLDRDGHSLAAVRIAAAVEKRYGMKLPLSELMRDNLSLVSLNERVTNLGPAAQPATAAKHRAKRAPKVQPLTSGQRAVWADEQLKDTPGSYAVVGALSVEARLDSQRLMSALDYIVDRHDALTARREYFASGPALVMGRRSMRRGSTGANDGSLLRIFAGTSLEAATTELVGEMASFSELPLRAGLMQGKRNDVIILAIDHLVADAESLDIVFSDLAAAYDATPMKTDEVPSFAAFLERQRTFENERREGAVERWRNLGGVGLPLPLEAPTTVYASEGQVTRTHAELDAQRTSAVRQALRDRQFTLAPVLVAAVASVVGRGQGTDEALLGVPVSQRRAPDDQGVVGMTLGVLPLKVPVKGSSTMRLEAARDGLLSGREYAAVGLGELVRLSGGSLDLQRMPVRVWANDLTGRRPPPIMAGATTSYVDHLVAPAPFPLNIYLSDVEGGLNITLTCNDGAFLDPGYPSEMAMQVLDEVEALALERQSPRQSMADVSSVADNVVPSKTSDILAVLRNAPGPGRVFEGNISLDREELWRQVDAAAGRFANVDLPVGASVLVAAERSYLVLVTMLALWQRGLSPVIVDGALPSAVLANRAQAAAAQGIVTGVPPTIRPTRDIRGSKVTRELGSALFTSGTTGEPQVIPMKLTALYGSIVDYLGAVDLTPNDRLGLTSGLGHDPMFRDLLAPLLAGAELHVPDPGAMRDPRLLFDFVVRSRLTVLHATPSLMKLMMAGRTGDTIDDLRLIVSGGETLTRALVDSLSRLAPNARVVNSYGCTESSQIASVLDVTNSLSVTEALPVGSRCGRTSVHVFSSEGKALTGELGELVISGPWVTPGNGEYASFLSGDIGRVDTEGLIHIQGRKDRQLTVAGHRVRPERIEAEARYVSGVDQTWVGLDEKIPDTLILAFTVRDTASDPSAELRRHLGSTLPAHEQPSRLLLVQDFALDDHQKRIGPGRPVRTFGMKAANVEAGENQIALFIEREVGILLDPLTNFFDGGLTSLQLLHLRESLQNEVSHELAPTALFEFPNVRALAAHLAQKGASNGPLRRRSMEVREGESVCHGTRTRGRSRHRRSLYEEDETR